MKILHNVELIIYIFHSVLLQWLNQGGSDGENVKYMLEEDEK
jgi:hypothetical protein